MVQIIVLATLQPLQALITVQTTCEAAMVFPLFGLSLFSQSLAGAVSAALAAGAAMVETVQMVQVSKDGQPERISMRALL